MNRGMCSLSPLTIVVTLCSDQMFPYPGIDGGPVFSPTVATSVCILYTLLYVGVIYLSPITRPRPGLNRNSSFVIRARVRAATIITMLCVLGTSGMLFFWTRKNWWNTLSFMGFAHITPQSALDIIRALLLTSVLFAGPFLERLLSGVIAGEGGIVSGGVNWVGWRNYVIVRLTPRLSTSDIRRSLVIS
jgi:prenyl protein peptidase